MPAYIGAGIGGILCISFFRRGCTRSRRGIPKRNCCWRCSSGKFCRRPRLNATSGMTCISHSAAAQGLCRVQRPRAAFLAAKRGISRSCRAWEGPYVLLSWASHRMGRRYCLGAARRRQRWNRSSAKSGPGTFCLPWSQGLRRSARFVILAAARSGCSDCGISAYRG